MKRDRALNDGDSHTEENGIQHGDSRQMRTTTRGSRHTCNLPQTVIRLPVVSLVQQVRGDKRSGTNQCHASPHVGDAKLF